MQMKVKQPQSKRKQQAHSTEENPLDAAIQVPTVSAIDALKVTLPTESSRPQDPKAAKACFVRQQDHAMSLLLNIYPDDKRKLSLPEKQAQLYTNSEILSFIRAFDVLLTLARTDAMRPRKEALITLHEANDIAIKRRLLVEVIMTRKNGTDMQTVLTSAQRCGFPCGFLEAWHVDCQGELLPGTARKK